MYTCVVQGLKGGVLKGGGLGSDSAYSITSIVSNTDLWDLAAHDQASTLPAGDTRHQEVVVLEKRREGDRCVFQARTDRLMLCVCVHGTRRQQVRAHDIQDWMQAFCCVRVKRYFVGIGRRALWGRDREHQRPAGVCSGASQYGVYVYVST